MNTAVRKGRYRPYYLIWIALVVVAGCASRSAIAEYWPDFIALYAGDALWSLMFFLGLGILLPSARTFAIALAVIVFSFGIEVSQLCHADWLEAFRNTLPGALLMGSDFLWSDLVCYTAGVGIGVSGEYIAQIVQKKRVH
jgi:hypothetical protein